MIITTEVPHITKYLYEENINCKITVIVLNRMHNLRFMPISARGTQTSLDQNIRPGTVIDTTIVHPTFDEFYLNAHVALQGTVKTPRFTTLIDENEFTADELQGLCYALCFGHQIIRVPTSLPSPVYIATRYAERGRELISAVGAYASLSGNYDEDFNNISNALPYSLSEKIRDIRINA